MLRDKKCVILTLLAVSSLASSRIVEAHALNDQMWDLAKEAGIWILILGAVGGAAKSLWSYSKTKVENRTENKTFLADTIMGVFTGMVGYLVAEPMPDNWVPVSYLPGVILIAAFLGSHILDLLIGKVLNQAIDAGLSWLPRRTGSEPPAQQEPDK